MVETLAEDWRQLDPGPRLGALLAYSEKLTRSPAEIGEQDVRALRDAGLGDEAVLHACEVAAYYNFVNRTAEGLGVCLEEHWSQPPVGEREGGQD